MILHNIHGHPHPHHWRMQYTSRIAGPNVFHPGVLSLAKALQRTYVAVPIPTSLSKPRNTLTPTKSYSPISHLGNFPITHVHIQGHITILVIIVINNNLIITHPSQHLRSQIHLMRVRISDIWCRHQTSTHSPSDHRYRKLP